MSEKIDQLIAYLWRVNRYLRAGMLEEKGLQITRVQWMILRFIKRNSSCAIGQLASHMNVRSSTMSQMLDRLEKESLIMRKLDSHDSRIRIVTLTEKGEAIVTEIETLWHERLAKPLSTLSEDEQDQLVQLMMKLAQATSDQDES